MEQKEKIIVLPIRFRESTIKKLRKFSEVNERTISGFIRWIVVNRLKEMEEKNFNTGE